MASTNIFTTQPSRLSYNDYDNDERMDSPLTTVSEIKIPLKMEKDHDEGGEENVGPDYCKTNSNVRGVFLTCDDLWVTVPNGKNGCESILQGLTGYGRPGELLAIMGPSGCGKTTILYALSGRLASKSKQCGENLVNGRRKQQLAYGTSAYATHDNVLTWTLTRREAAYYFARLQLPNTMLKAEKLDRADRTIREMGLQSCIDTRIGGWGSEGLSTVQQRRLSICIEMLTRPKLCLLSSENQFFARNGFPCPDFQNPADHYLRLINTNFDKDHESAVEGKTTTKEVIDKLVESYASSDAYDLLLREEQINGQQLRVMEKKRSRTSFFVQRLVLTEWSFMNTYRDLGYHRLGLAIYITLAIGLGTVFCNVGNSYNSINARCSMIMFVVSLLTLMTVGGFPSFVEEMKVFRRERLNGHYGVLAIAISNSISSIFFLILVAIIPGMIVIASAMFATSLLVKNI